MTPDVAILEKYLVPVEITVRGEMLYQTPQL
jgi:hypothetical protein